jgi:DNA-binding SARP family transcriptional activator
METFWPDSTPEAARNSMNVTIHNLRRILRFPDAVQSILFHEGGYRLNPSIVVWADLDEFEILIREGRRLETAGKNLESIQKYEAAVALYQGDFLSEDPYEEWPVTQRERLRTLYLDTLDRLSQQYFTQGDFNTSVQLCQRILNRDACREDVHRRVMRCYSRLGQDCLAIRQYQICTEVLKSELEVEPETSTRQLSEKIRHRERV